MQEIQVCVSKAILLRDAFSEETITNGIRIWTPFGKRPLKKPEGYWLFLNMGTETFEAEITSPIYQPLRLCLKPDQGRTVEEFLLYPSRSYPLQSGRTSVLGTAPKGAELWFHLEQGVEEGKLLLDYQKDNPRISIYAGNRTGIKGSGWYIRDREKKAGEYFRIRQKAEEANLLNPLKKSYRKKDSLLFPAWRCPADENGEFFLLLPRLKQETYRLYCSCRIAGHTVLAETEISGERQNIWQIGKGQ